MFIELEPIFNNIGAIKKFESSLDLSGLDIGGQKPLKTPVSIHGRVANETGVVKLIATADLVYDALCDRCAADVKTSLAIPVEHILVTSLNNEENDEFLLISDMRFNLDEIVTEDILLSLPSRHLCSEDCKGLCQHCGKNLNTDSCSCKAAADPRLAVLKQLLDNEE